jgi:hypothetical protein
MPRSIILRPPAPGGASGVKRRRYTAREKIAIVSKICSIKRETNCSYRQAAALIGVSHTLVFHWHALRERFNNIDIKKLPHYSDYEGHCGQLESVKDKLLAWIFKRREMGLDVSTLSIIIKACCLLPLMEQKSALARYFVTRRFSEKHSIVYRMWTKVSQCPPGEVCQEAQEFRDFIRPMLQGPEHDLRWFINMDQTPVFFLCIPKNARDSWQEDHRYQDLNKRHKVCYLCAYHHGSRRPVGPHGCV